MMYRRTTIEEVGLERWLNGTRDEHNGRGYEDFKKMLQFETPKTKMADKFSVSRLTIDRWIIAYLKEDLEDV